MRVAAIDCGTNSIRLLVAETDDSGGLGELHRQLQLVRLGEGVDATGRFSDAALARTLGAARDFAQVISDFQVPTVRTRFVATSAARDAANSSDFFDGVRGALGVPAEIITGEEEAHLSFVGAIAGVGQVRDPVLVTDIGGGSTELVIGTRGVVEQAASLDIGSVRLRERFLPSDPPTADELTRARRYVDDQLDGLGFDLAAARQWVGVAGTVTSLAAVALGLSSYDRQLVHRANLGLGDLRAVADEIARSSVEAVMDSGPVPLRRAQVLAGGAIICERIAERVSVAELTVSESDILDGIAAALAK